MIIHTSQGYYQGMTPDFWNEYPYFTLAKEGAYKFTNKIIAKYKKYILEEEFKLKNVRLIENDRE